VWCPLTLPVSYIGEYGTTEISPSHLQVALELLDYHYADEKVRTMAVKTIDRLLSNDELHNFLLQLVQVIV